MVADDILRTVIVAMFSGSELSSRLVLKGGSALRLVYGISTRRSLDVDFSVANDFDSAHYLHNLVLESLNTHLKSQKYSIFNIVLTPGIFQHPTMLWRTYRLALQMDLWNGTKGHTAIDNQTSQQINLSIEISTHEYCDDHNKIQLHGKVVSVYSPRMIVLEKLRAICQHMPDYSHCCTTCPRSRDFFDIYCLITKAGVNFGDACTSQVAQKVFALRDVPFEFLNYIPKYRKLHSADWQRVEGAVSEPLQPFDFYFDYVCAQVEQIKSLWSPLMEHK